MDEHATPQKNGLLLPQAGGAREGTAALLRPADVVRPAPPERFFTPAALQRAWRAVRQAGGGAGVDAVTLAAFAARLGEELARLRQDLVEGRYRPRPVRRVLVPKRSGGLRPLAVWALRDRVAQRVVYDIVAPSFEETFLPCSFGYRPGLGPADALARVAGYRMDNLRWVMHGDIEDCFERIPTDRLGGLIRQRVEDPLLRHYIDGWLGAEILNEADGSAARAGAGQGGVLSPLLANIYLNEVDHRLTAEARLALVRYADDLLVCCRRRADAEMALAAVAATLQEFGLRLNARKTRVVHFDQGFAWLGHFLLRDECYPLK
jgi:CRISPR-associated protein Cas1